MAALVVTGVVGFATTNATERMETIEYTVEQNESLNEKCARNMECTLKNPYKNLDDYIERCLNTDFIKKIYEKHAIMRNYYYFCTSIVKQNIPDG